MSAVLVFFFFFFVSIPGCLVFPLVWNLLQKSKLEFSLKRPIDTI